MEERIIELEIRSSFQEQKIETLQEAVYAQLKEIEKLSARLAAAERHIVRLSSGSAGEPPADEKPPHY